MRISHTHQKAVQADESTPLIIVGEVNDIQLVCGSHTFEFDGLVTETDIGDIIAGEPFLEINGACINGGSRRHSFKTFIKVPILKLLLNIFLLKMLRKHVYVPSDTKKYFLSYFADGFLWP